MRKRWLVVVFVPAVTWACPKGQVAWREGVCAVELQPIADVKADSTAWVSDEKPPKTTTGQWQADSSKVISLPSQTEQTEADDQIAYAKAHGIPPKGN